MNVLYLTTALIMKKENLLQKVCKFLPEFTVSQITTQSVSESPSYTLRCDDSF